MISMCGHPPGGLNHSAIQRMTMLRAAIRTSRRVARSTDCDRIAIGAHTILRAISSSAYMNIAVGCLNKNCMHGNDNL